MNRIKFLRETAGLTQKELAKKIGQSSSNISKYEVGVLEPNIKVLKALSDLFDVSIDFIVGATDLADRPVADAESYIYIMGSRGIGERIKVPADKVERLKALLDAGIPELREK